MRIDEGFQEETNDVETYLTVEADLVPGQLAKIAASHFIPQGLHLGLVTSIGTAVVAQRVGAQQSCRQELQFRYIDVEFARLA
jgi:hypothetical protein